jgi:hypothetical protein
MTWTEFCVTFICHKGVHEITAKKIVAYAKEHKIFTGTMASRWDDKVADLPDWKPSMKISIKAVAHEWIEANEPQAYYKQFFALTCPAQ